MGNEILQPSVSLSLTSADLDVANAAQKVLLVGQMVAAGTATTGVLETAINNEGIENTLFGQQSQLARMVKAFKEIAPGVQLDVIPLDDAAGTAATYTITCTGPATESGTIDIIAGSKHFDSSTATVSNGNSATQVGDAVAAAINANPNRMFNAVNATGTVTLTCVHDGTIGNEAVISAVPNGAIAGVIGGVATVVADAVPGGTDPTLTSIFDAVGSNRYQGIVWPYAAVTEPVDFLDGRFNVNNRVLDGVCFTGISDTYSNVNSFGTALNSKSLVVIGDEYVDIANYNGPSNQETPWLVATWFAALRALRLTTDASIGQYLTTSSSRDQFGGTALASLPYFNSTIPQLSTTISGAGFTETEIELLHTAGVTVIGQNATGTNSLIGEVVTTYKTDPAANPDVSWKYLNYVDTMSAVREYFFNNYKARFAQSRLTEGNVLRGRDMVNKSLFEAYTDQLYGDLSGSDYVLCQAGEVALNFFKANRTVDLDLSLGKITVSMLTPIVTQTRVIIGTIQIAFSTQES